MRSVLESHRASRSPVPTHGADGDRTHDLRLAKPALSQLSYSPEGCCCGAGCPGGLEGRIERPLLKVPRAYPHTSGCVPAPAPVVSVLILTSSVCEPIPIVSTLRQIKRSPDGPR